MSNIRIVEVIVNVEVITKYYASFKCGEYLSGLIHSASSEGPFTVYLDEGYLFGKFVDEEDAIKSISLLKILIDDFNDISGLDYAAYREAYNAGASSRLH